MTAGIVLSSTIASASLTSETAVTLDEQASEWDDNWGVHELLSAPVGLAATTVADGELALHNTGDSLNYVAINATGGGDNAVIYGGRKDNGGTYVNNEEVWIKASSGKFLGLVGGSCANNWDVAGASWALNADTHIVVDGAEVGHVIGGFRQECHNPVLTGDTYISIKSGNITGNIVGSNLVSDGDANTSTHKGNSHVYIYTPLNNTTNAVYLQGGSEGAMDIITGGALGAYINGMKHRQALYTMVGDTDVVVDLNSYSGSETGFKKAIYGGSHIVRPECGQNDCSVVMDGNTNVTITGAGSITFAGDIVGGSHIQGGAASISGTSSVSIDGGTYAGMVVGGSIGEAKSTTTVGGTSVNLSGGTYQQSVIGGTYAKAGAATASVGDVKVAVSGAGTSTGIIYGGSYIGGTDETAITASVGNININMTGGTVAKLVGGSYVERNAADSTVKQGDVTLNLEGGSITGNVYAAGSQQGSTTISTGNVAVKLGSALAMTSGTISAGYELAPAPAPANAAAGSTITGSRTLELVGSQDRSGVTIDQFDTIKVTTADTTAKVGSITGATGLTKTGAGELRLSGASTYTSATTVAEGTLSLLGGASLASSAVTVADAAVLQLDTQDSSTIAMSGVLSGSGTLLKTGTGSATIGSVADSFAGSIALQGGSLNVGDSFLLSEGRELSVGMYDAVLESTLTLGAGKLSVDASGTGAATSLNNAALTLLGGTQLQLSGGNGGVYDLFTGISGLLGADGSALELTEENNAIANYFDTTRPGTGFWAGATLVLNDGTLQLVRHNETVKEAVTITTRQTSGTDYQYYAGVTFEWISTTSDGGAIYGDTITLSDNGSVTFIGNTASGSAEAYGGAIDGPAVTMTGNGDVSFSGNTASASSSAYGGAIYGYDDITLSDNGNVVFEENTASSSDYSACGGALCGSVTMTGNGSVVFEGNTASSSEAYGGAIYGYGGSTITLSDNGSVTFSGNLASSSDDYACGGAIYRSVTMTGNGDVSFSGNLASSSDYYAFGGAIDGSVTMEGNGSVTFIGNTASGSFSALGGAIEGSVTMTGNGDVSFSGNTAESSSSVAAGGAICGSVTMEGNGSVTFIGNTASGSSYARGGAIYDPVTMTGNGDVSFSGNTASSSEAYGGAICGSVTMEGNGSVTFIGNTASGSTYAYGGAIYTDGYLNIRNNDSVEFSQNAEVENGTYRLRSIYAGGSGSEISLSAAEGKSITFRDSIYIGEGSSFKLNEAYEGKAQLGDIIFTGATTVDDLYEVKGNVAGTEEEIRLSRTTEVNALTNLYGGRLRVEDGAIYQGQGITVHEGSGATVQVKDATLSHSGYDLTFNAGTTLELAGTNSITGNVQMLEGSTMRLIDATVNGAEIPLIFNAGTTLELAGTNSITGNVQMLEGSILSFDGSETQGVTCMIGNLSFTGAPTLSLGESYDWTGENHALLCVDGAISGWDADTLTVLGSAYGSDNLYWLNNDLLVLNYNAETFNPHFRGDIVIRSRQQGPAYYKYFGDVSFKNITHTEVGLHSFGGSIYGKTDSTITLIDNGSVTFSGNTASTHDGAYGGAIYGDCNSTITLSNNGGVDFYRNTATGFDYTYGGAIYGACNSTITLSNNDSVEFYRNTAYSSSMSAYGGAIYGDATITLSNNGRVAFIENSASAPGYYAYGGAIYGEGTITLSNNDLVWFSGNTASSVAFSAYGGAIYNEGNLSICNNDSVLFEKNVEKVGSSYRLRGIYVGGSDTVTSLSAAVGKSIEFRDSVYVASGSTVNLNADYTYVDSEGVSVTIKQQGDILFTGKYTETHLNELLASAEAGRAATAEEIRLSRTTVVRALTNLYGGRLRVEDGAIYQGQGIMVHEGSGATVRVKDATLSHSGYDLTFNAGTTLELEGTNSITGNVQMLEGSTMRLKDATVNGAEIPLSFNAGTTLELEGTNSITGDVQMLEGSTMRLKAGTNSITGNVQMLEGSILSFDGTETQNMTCLTGNLSFTGAPIVSLGDTPAWTGENHALLCVGGTISGWDAGTLTVLGSAYGSDNLHCLNNDLLVLNYNAETFNPHFRGDIVITSRQQGPAVYKYFEDVSFENITGASDGGAISGSTIRLYNNGSVTFSGNSATAGGDDPSARGGAIYGDSDSTITLCGNDSVKFSGNSSDVYGGAIYGGSDSTITLSNNGSVTFSGNTAFTFKDGLLGGAIYGGSGSTITLNDNGSVEFSGNQVFDGHGAAIYGGSGSTITLNDNDSVKFSGNLSYEAGSAIYGSTITLSNNGRVEFIENAGTRSGVAICGHNITLSNNVSVEFIGNAGTRFGGGAIYGGSGGTITLNDNVSVVFEGNTSSLGGAIDGVSDSTITLSNNGSVTFSGNTASSTSSSAKGGAIYGAPGSNITLSNNGSVTFSGNTASSTSSSAEGGAINTWGGNLNVRNNDSVLFEKNAEVSNGTYRLRSIYVDGGSYAETSLSAAAGKSIEFRDSVYVASGSTVNLNADYTYVDSEGVSVTIKQQGDILFTGATTVADLYEVKGNVAGTEEEIRLSRTTEVNALTNLYGGRLRVEDGAIYQGQGIMVHEGSGATVRVKDATLSHSGYDLTFNAGTTLELEGTNSITGNVVMKGSSMLAFNYDAALLDAASMSLSGSLTLNGEIALQLKGFEEHEGAYKLISLSSATLSGWGDENIRLQGTDGAEISWDKLSRYGDTVYYVNQNLGTATWTNASGDGKWNNFSYNWEENGKNYAYTQGVDVVFGSETSGSTITLEGDLAVRNMQVTGESSYEIQYAADSSLRIDSALQVESGSSLSLGGAVSAGEVQNAGTMTVLGDMTVQGAVNGAGALTVGGALSAASLNADTLTLTGAEATSRITGDVVLSGAATVAGALEVGGSFTSGTLQVKSLTVDTFISTGKLTGDSNTLTALNGNIELTDEHESLYGNSNVITATGGDVRLTDNMTGSGNVITAVAANGVGGSILRGNGTALWASIAGQNNELTADGNIELESINQGNNTLHAKTGSIVISAAVSGGNNTLTAGTTISTGSMTGSDNTLSASGNMTVGAITGDCNELTSTGGYILLRDNATLDGEYNKLTAAAVVQAGNITGDENELVAGKHVDINGNLNGNNNSITCNATMNTTDNAIDISGTIGSSSQNANNNTLTAVRGNIRTGAITGTGNTLTAQAGNITTGNVSGGDNVLTAQAGSITAASIAGAGNVVTARSLTVTGDLEGATLTLTDGDASNSIGGDVVLSGAATVAGSLEVSGSFTSGTLQVKSLTADGPITTGKLTGDSATLTALNGNVELTNEHESLNGNSNVITATGGDVRLTDDMTGSRNIITAKAVDGVGGSILRGNGTALWASIAGQNNELTADGRIELESINQGNNTLIAGGAIVNDGGTISINSINGSTNTLTATNGSIRVGNIGNAAKSDNNRLTAAGHVYVQGQLTGDGNYLESNKAPGDGNSISIWNGINGSGNRILANAGSIAMSGGDLTGDNNSLTSVHGNVSVRNVSGTGNTLSAVDGDIVASSIAGTAASLSAASLQINGSGGLNLVDSALNITGDITSAGAVVLAGADNTVLWNAGRFSGSGSVSITGGSLELADDTDALAVTGAVSISNAELRGSWTGTGLSIGGSSVAQGAAVVLRDVTLTSSLSNEGSLSFGGAVAVQADGLVSASSFTKYSAGESGYRYEEKAYTLVTGRGSSAALDGTVWSLSGDANAPSDASFSYADGILTATGAQDLSAYWVNGAVQYDGSSEFAAAASLVLNGGHLTMSQGLGTNLTGGIRVDKSSTLTLGNGVEVQQTTISGATASNKVTLEGSGKLNMGASADLTGYKLGTGWTGTVKLAGITSNTNLHLNTIGQAGSFIELVNAKGYTGAQDKTVAANLVLNKSTAADGTEQAAFLVSDGYSSTTEGYVMTTFSGAMSGAGKMVFDKTLSSEYTGFKFTGNVKAWTGAFEMNAGKTFNLVFGGNATEINAAVLNNGTDTTLNLKLEANAATAVNGQVDVSSIAIGNDHDVSFDGTVETDNLAAGKGTVKFAADAEVRDSFRVNAGAEIQIQSGARLQNRAVALSAAPGTAAAQLSSKAGGDLVMMQQAGGLCIQDVLMMNTCISAAEGTEVMLSGVEGSENVHLLGGADFSLTFANNKADVGMAVIENSSPVTGITLSAGSTLTLVMDPSNNLCADYSLIINMTGFEYEGGSLAATGDITDLNAAGIYLGGWLGELLAAQGVAQEGVGNLESPEVPGDSIPTVSYTYSTDDNVGMIISIHGLSVPEPTTTTLSLLALVALAARRRRK